MDLFFTVDKGFQGLLLEAPSAVYVEEVVQHPFPWEGRSAPSKVMHDGTLRIDGVFAVFVAPGEQEAIWSGFPDNVNFVMTDLQTGTKHTRNRVDGGWRLARQGMSVSIAPATVPKQDYSTMPSGEIVQQRFTFDVFDDLWTIPAPETTVEIYLEYRGFTSNREQVKVLSKAN